MRRRKLAANLTCAVLAAFMVSGCSETPQTSEPQPAVPQIATAASSLQIPQECWEKCGWGCDPVCGDDGNTYNNICLIECAGIGYNHDGPCSSSSKEVCTECDQDPKCKERSESCGCDLDRCEPVCGKDWITFPNECVANCFGFGVVSEGPCPEEYECGCPDICEPVCGVDKKTYQNKCHAEQVPVEILHEGPCEEEVPDCKNCECDGKCDPVCGDDGITYDNECQAKKCADVGVDHYGACPNQPSSCETIISNCGCDPLACEPVCGEDGRTYDNKCIPDCNGIGVRHEGPCTAEDFKCDCDCSDECEPVCGKDGKSYRNSCLAECEGVEFGEGACSHDPIECDGGAGGTGGTGGTGGEGGTGGGTGGTGGSGCDDICEPVCGKDGTTYRNKCEADVLGGGVAYEGPCKIPALCKDCDCDPKCEPVCGDDGLTYDNKCQAEKCAEVKPVHEGACASDPFSCKKCDCELICEPVCGDDGQTYNNECMAKCAGVGVAHEGECIEEYECGCPDICEPVCGKDGKTYENECLANQVPVEIAHDGPCKEETPECKSCDCGDKCDPVCGDDGKTYDNECKAKKCAKVGIDHYGACPSSPESCLDIIGNCGCDPMKCEPVCGDDGKTYDNACTANCRGIGVRHDGPCTAEDFECDECECPDVCEPVCGEDGKDYKNECFAECAGVKVKASGLCGSGPHPCEG